VRVRRRLLCAGLALPLVGGALQARAAAAPGKTIEVSDSIDLPPARREFWARGRKYLLVIENTDHWRTLYPSASLFDTSSSTPRRLWTRVLTQQFGPRTAATSAQGQVLLVDEWINVTSRQAVQVIDLHNRIVATHDHAAVVAALGASAEAVVRAARSGTWLTAGPELSDDGRVARLAAGGRTLVVSLADGRLASEP
jgi:hypothetical protein